MAGTLWSDPVSKQGVSESSRGIGILFGPDITQRFLGKANYFHIFIFVKMIKKLFYQSYSSGYVLNTAYSFQKIMILSVLLEATLRFARGARFLTRDVIQCFQHQIGKKEYLGEY